MEDIRFSSIPLTPIIYHPRMLPPEIRFGVVGRAYLAERVEL
jgi:hypothetical protein